jgi:hypothetical protein
LSTRLVLHYSDKEIGQIKASGAISVAQHSVGVFAEERR